MNREVTNEEKYLNTLRDSGKDDQKRFSTLKSLLKLYSDQPSGKGKIRFLYNNDYTRIFPLYFERISKMQTSTIGRIVGLNLAGDHIPDLIRLLEEFFYYLEPPKIQSLMKKYKEKLTVFCYKTIDYSNNKEIRKSIFSIMLEILDSYDNIFKGDLDILLLVLHSIDFQSLFFHRGESVSNIADVIYCNPKIENMFTGEWTKLLKEHPNQLAVTSDDFARELIIKLFAFIKDRAQHPQQWLELFKCTWMQIFFPEITIAERNDAFNYIQFFSESLTRDDCLRLTENVKPLFIQRDKLPNSILKTVLQMLFELMLIDSKALQAKDVDTKTLLIKDDFLVVLAMIKNYCNKPEASEEINKILDLFCKFALGKAEILIDNMTFEEMSFKILEHVVEIFKLDFADFNYFGEDVNNYRLFRIDETALRLYQIYMDHHPQFIGCIKESFFNYLDALQHQINTTQNFRAKQITYLILSKLIFMAISDVYTEREAMISRLNFWLQVPEFKKKLCIDLLEETRSLVNLVYKDESLAGLSFKMCQDQECFVMKSEYVLQFLLQKFCEECVQSEDGSCIRVFERDSTSLQCILEGNSEPVSTESQEARKKLDTQFKKWIRFMIVLFSQKNTSTSNGFNILYEGLSNIIDYLIDPDRDFVQERGKPVPKPKYSLPTQTHLQFFRVMLKNAFEDKDPERIDGRLQAIKSYCRIFCETRSEVPLGKKAVLEINKFIYRGFQAYIEKPDSRERYLACCIILYYTQEIFSMDYEGTLVLMPAYLKIIEYVLFNEKMNYEEETTSLLTRALQRKHPMIAIQASALLVLKSLLSFSHGLPTMKVVYYDKGPATIDMQAFAPRIIDLANRFCDKQIRTIYSKNEEVMAEHTDIELNYSLKTLLFMIICYQASEEANEITTYRIQECLNNFFYLRDNSGASSNQELFYLHVYGVSALATAISPSSSWHQTLYKEIILKLMSFITNFKGPSDLSQRRDMMMELLFSLLTWILTDHCGYLLVTSQLRSGLIDLFQYLDSKDDYKDINDLFFKHFIKNYLNFPAKLQREDNVRSIFDEYSFKHIPKNYSKIVNDLRKSKKESLNAINSPVSMSLLVEDNKNLVNSDMYKNKSELNSPDHATTPIDLAVKRLRSTPNTVADSSPELSIDSLNRDSNKLESGEHNQIEQLLYPFKNLLTKESISRLFSNNGDNMIDTLNSLINSSTSENIDNFPPLFYFYEDGTVVSLIDLANKKENSKNTKIMMRNVTGKHAWEFKHLKAMFDKGIGATKPTLQNINAKTFYTNLSMRADDSDDESINRKSYQKDSSVLCLSESLNSMDDQDGGGGSKVSSGEYAGEKQAEPLMPLYRISVDRVERIESIIDLSKQGSNEPEIERHEKRMVSGDLKKFKIHNKEPSDQLDRFEGILNIVKAEIEDFTKFDEFHKNERKDAENIFTNEILHQEEKKRKQDKNDEYEQQRIQDKKKLTDNRNYLKFSERVISHNSFDSSRLLMLQLKLFNPMEKLNPIALLDSRNSHFQSSLNLLDHQSYVRETIKVGVIYVAYGQDTQQEILRNSSGSKDYEDFIKSLGDVVDLKTHLGFAGGLKYKTDGEYTIYSSDSLTEVMYHVATMMPLDADDEQVISKKRHIGNDHVNIVWCENPRDYRRLTISSQYNCVQIIIYPLKNGLYRVKFSKKDIIGFIFPWLSSLVVTRELLPTLVKICAINGFRRSRNPRETPFKSYFNRLKFIKEIRSSHVPSQNDMKVIALSLITGQFQVEKSPGL